MSHTVTKKFTVQERWGYTPSDGKRVSEGLWLVSDVRGTTILPLNACSELGLKAGDEVEITFALKSRLVTERKAF